MEEDVSNQEQHLKTVVSHTLEYVFKQHPHLLFSTPAMGELGVNLPPAKIESKKCDKKTTPKKISLKDLTTTLDYLEIQKEHLTHPLSFQGNLGYEEIVTALESEKTLLEKETRKKAQLQALVIPPLPQHTPETTETPTPEPELPEPLTENPSSRSEYLQGRLKTLTAPYNQYFLEKAERRKSPRRFLNKLFPKDQRVVRLGEMELKFIDAGKSASGKTELLSLSNPDQSITVTFKDNQIETINMKLKGSYEKLFSGPISPQLSNFIQKYLTRSQEKKGFIQKYLTPNKEKAEMEFDLVGVYQLLNDNNKKTGSPPMTPESKAELKFNLTNMFQKHVPLPDIKISFDIGKNSLVTSADFWGVSFGSPKADFAPELPYWLTFDSIQPSIIYNKQFNNSEYLSYDLMCEILSALLKKLPQPTTSR